jgi:hypothetical protein
MSVHLISVIVRDDTGALRVVSDRVSIEHTDDHAELEKVVRDRVSFGDATVLVLLDDDSVARHWTRPADVSAAMPDQGESVLGLRGGRGARRHVAKKAAKRKAKR